MNCFNISETVHFDSFRLDIQNTGRGHAVAATIITFKALTWGLGDSGSLPPPLPGAEKEFELRSPTSY